MEEKIYGIKIFDTKDKEDVVIVIGLLLLLLAGALTNNRQEIYDAKYTAEDANKYLANIDTDIRQHINSVNVLDRKTTENICNKAGVDAPACAIIYTMNGKPTYADIYISNNMDNTGYSFEKAIYHEAGHIEAAFKIGISAAYSQQYADNYADKYTKQEISYTKN